MQDLAQCPNGLSHSTRTCPGSQFGTQMQVERLRFPTSSGSATELQQMVEALVYLATNNSREIFLTILDPYSVLDNPLLVGQRELGNNRIE